MNVNNLTILGVPIPPSSIIALGVPTPPEDITVFEVRIYEASITKRLINTVFDAKVSPHPQISIIPGVTTIQVVKDDSELMEIIDLLQEQNITLYKDRGLTIVQPIF